MTLLPMCRSTPAQRQVAVLLPHKWRVGARSSQPRLIVGLLLPAVAAVQERWMGMLHWFQHRQEFKLLLDSPCPRLCNKESPDRKNDSYSPQSQSIFVNYLQLASLPVLVNAPSH